MLDEFKNFPVDLSRIDNDTIPIVIDDKIDIGKTFCGEVRYDSHYIIL